MRNKPIYQTWMTVIYDRSLHIKEIINPQHCMLLQLNEDELLGKNIQEIEELADKSNKKPAAIIAKNVRKAFDENRNVYFEYVTSHKDGSSTYAVCYAEHGPDDLLYINVIKIDEENIFEAREGFTNYIFDVSMNNLSVGVGMRHITEDGIKKYILFNDIAKDIYEQDNVLESPHWNQEEDDAADAKTLQLRDPLKIEKIIRDHLGNIKRWIVLTKKKILSKAGGYYIITTMVDITQRRQKEILLEQQFSLLDTMYSQLPVGIVIFNRLGCIVSLNEKEKEIFGIKGEDVIGHSFFDDTNLSDEIKEKVRRCENVEYEMLYDFNYIKSSKSKPKYLSIKMSAIRNKDGEVDGFLKISEDITDKRLKERILIESGIKFKSVFSSMSSGIEIYDRDGLMIDCNECERKIFGIESKQALLDSGLSLFNNPNLSPELIKDLMDGIDVKFEMWYDFDLVRRNNYYTTTKSGKACLEVKGAPMVTDSHELIGYVFEINDITETRLQEAHLKEVHENLDLSLKAGQVSAWSYDFATQTFTPLLGTPLVEIGSTFEGNKQYIYPDDYAYTNQLFENIGSGKIEHGNCTIRYFDKKTSKYRYFDMDMSAGKDENGKVERLICIQQDVTEKNRRAAELDSTRRSLDLIMDESRILAWDFDVYTNERRILYGHKILGKHGDIYKENEDYSGPEFAAYRELINRIISGEVDNGTFDMRMKESDTDIYRIYEHTICGIRNKDGKISSLIGTMCDVTERVERQEMLEKSREDLNLALKAGDLAAWTYDIDKREFRTLQGNAIAGEAMSWENSQKILHPDDREMQNEVFGAIIKGEKSTGSAIFRYKFRNGIGEDDYRYYESRMVGKEINGKMAFITGTQKDITESYRRQQELEEQNIKTRLINEVCNIIQWDYNPYTHTLVSYSVNALAPSKELNIEKNPEMLFDFIHPDDIAKTKEFLHNADLMKSESIHLTYRLKYPGSANYTNLVSDGVAIRDNSGAIIKYSGIDRNVDTWVKMNEELKMQNITTNVILKNINSLILYTGVDGKVKWSNADSYPDLIKKIDLKSFLVNNKCKYEENEKCTRSNAECLIYASMKQRMILTKNVDFDEVSVKITSIPIIDNDNEVRGVLYKIDNITNERKINEKLKYLKDEAVRVNQILTEIIEKMPCALYIKDYDNDLRFVTANKVFCEYLERNDSDIIGKTDYDLFSEEAAQYHIDKDNQVINNWESLIYEDNIKVKGGTRYWHIIKSPIKLITGQRYTIGIGLDISKLKSSLIELENKKNETTLINGILNEIIDRIPGAFYIKNAADDFRYLRANNEFCNITGKSLEEIIGNTDYDIFEKESAELYRIYDKKLAEGAKVVSYEGSMPLLDNKYWHIRKSLLELPNNERYILGIALNTTEIHNVNEELKEARNKAEESDKLKSAFLANMSHEIRTPLNAIVGFSELLYDCADDREREEYINIIDTNNKLLLRLINDILDLSKIESGLIELKHESFDLAHVFEEIYSAFRMKMGDSNVMFITENPYKECVVNLDKNRFMQVVSNFISNAIKYTPSGHIKMSYTIVEGGVKVFVEDTGIGIAPDKHDKVFDRFEKLDDFAQGTGLGLSICRAIIEAQHGDIGFDTEVGRGSTFWAYFPTAVLIKEYK